LYGASQLYGEGLSLADRRLLVTAGEDGLLLLASVEPDQAPGEVVVHGGRGARRYDEGEETEVAGGGAEKEPLADTAPIPLSGAGDWYSSGSQPSPARSSEKRGRRDSTASAGSPVRAMISRTPETKERMVGVSRTYSSSPDR